MAEALTAGYNIQLVLVSVAIAILSSYTALDLAGRINATQGRTKLGWLASGATAMGIGIWSMHFIGMLAFRLPLPVRYNFLTVLGSILPAIIASGLALFLVSRPQLGWLLLLSGSVLMGTAIASMHYLGMAAMDLGATMHYDLRIVGVSVGIAIAVSFVGLFLVFRLRSENAPNQIWKKLLAALVRGLAIPTMHYTGMAAVCFMPNSNQDVFPTPQPPENALPLALAVMLGTLIVLSLALLTAFFDRRLAAQVIYTQAIQESQKYLQTILQGIQVGVLVISGEGQIQLSNQAALNLLNLPDANALVQWWQQASAQNSNPSFPTVLTQITTRQPVHNAIVELQSPNQSEPTSLLINAIPLEVQPASAPLMVCTLSEITELRRTEKRLQVSEAEFRELAQQEELLNDLSTQIRQSLDLPTILQTAVSQVRDIFATDRALIYQFAADWRGQVILEDFVAPWIPTIGEAADDCFPVECLDRYRNGSIRAINNTLEAGLDSAHLQFLQRLQVQSNLIVPIMVHSQLWGLLIVHQCSHPRVWKETEGNLLYRLAVQLGIAIQQSNLYTEAAENALQAKIQTHQAQESEAQLKQQTLSLQQTLRELQNLQLQLVQSEKMSSLGQLVAGVAHEINNPVNFIHGNLNHVQDYTDSLIDLVNLYQTQYPNPTSTIQAEEENIDLEFLREDLPKILSSMKVGTDRIRQIVLSLRNFSRMDEASFKAVDVHEGLESTVMILQHRLKARPERPAIAICRDYAELPLVECYPGQLNQVFMNILANAIDALEEATSPNQQMITLRTTRMEGNWVQIAIADNGPGIPASVREQIFNPFYTTKPIGKGTGMGLSISYQIIAEKHRGKLECRSAAGEGTEFLIQIPIHQVALQAA